MTKIKSANDKRYTVLLHQSVYHRLKSRGMFGESFSDVVDRLLDESEKVAAVKGDM